MLLRRHRLRILKNLLLLMCITVVSVSVYSLINRSQNIIIFYVRLMRTVSTSSVICRPFTVSDNRSFFEREPAQLNPPRKVSYSSREDLRYVHSLRLVTVVCARNVEKYIDNFRKYIEPIVNLFHSSSRILIFESDSTDETLEKFRQWPRAKVYTYGNLSVSFQNRSEYMAHCRNELLDKAYKLQADYILVTDVDIFNVSISAFLSNFKYDTDDWSVMTASARKVYYDILALRTISDSILNFNVLHRIWEIEHSAAGYCTESIVDQLIVNNQKPIPVDNGLIEVRSAFGGAGLYKTKATYGCKYNGNNSTCEHVPFHLCIREKNRGRIFINPKFQIG
jgi:hypothetical protein